MTPRRLIEPARLAGTAVLRTQSDDRLVDLVREGNDRAFEAIVHRYRHSLLRYCGRYLSAARADDAVQQTFVNAFRGIRDGDADINLRPWLYRIAHNASLNVLRQAGADHEQISEQIDGVETPPQALERGERLRTVVSAVRDLPERQRDALVLQALEGRSYDEIATELGVTGGAVRQLLNRARATLRQGATAFTPPALLARLGGVAEAPVAERVAQVVAGAGGGAAVAKGVAVLAVAGAVVGGAAQQVVSGGGGDRAGRAPAAVAAAPATQDAQTAGSGTSAGAKPEFAVLRSRGRTRRTAAQQRGSRTHRHGGSANGTEDSGGSSHSGDDHGGSRGGDDGGSSHGGDGHSGSGDGVQTLADDHSGPGRGGGDDSSGSGGGSDPVLPIDDSSGGSGSSVPSPNSGPGSGSSDKGSGSDDASEPADDGGISGGRH